jgi:alpha-tubulin suppressor-like RCC1 family protein
VNVTGARRDIAILATGGLHSCLVTTGGAVKCWGENSEGQLGDNTKLDRWTPVPVVGLQSGVTALSGGGYFTCAHFGDSSVKCWGANWAGQLGDGTNTRRKTPVDVAGLTGLITSLDTGDSHAC